MTSSSVRRQSGYTAKACHRSNNACKCPKTRHGILVGNVLLMELRSAQQLLTPEENQQYQQMIQFEKNGSRIIDFRKCYQKPGSKDGLFKLKRPAIPE